jgi:hypothetical protein
MLDSIFDAVDKTVGINIPQSVSGTGEVKK